MSKSKGPVGEDSVTDVNKEETKKAASPRKEKAKPGRARKSRPAKEASTAKESKPSKESKPAASDSKKKTKGDGRSKSEGKPASEGASREASSNEREPRQEDGRDRGSRDQGGKEAPRRDGSEFAVQTYFDRSAGEFVGSVLEFPDIRVSGASRDKVVREVESRLENAVRGAKKKGESLPEALASREYPDRLDVAVSQGLYRKLDRLSRSERVDLDRLVVELLSSAVEKRFSVAQPPRHSKPQHQPKSGKQAQGGGGKGNSKRQNNNNSNRDRDRGENRGNTINGNRRGGGKGYHQGMDSQDNFLEYVRNLEKGKWNKR